MNEQQRVNAALGTLLGTVGRAVWLAVRVDGASVGQVAREHKIPYGRAKDILATGDYAVEAASLIRIRSNDNEYKPNINGFHQTEDSL